MEAPRKSDNISMRMFCRCLLFFAAINAFSADLTTIGVTALWNFEPGLTGATVRVAQPEASVGPGAWQVDPAAAGQPIALFNWISSGGTAATFPNGLGTVSPHANIVGNNFYGISSGVAPGVMRVDNYDATYF